MERAVIVGASGYLGRRLAHHLGDRGVGTYRSNPIEGFLPFDADTETLPALLSRAGSGVTHVFVPYGAIDPERCARDPAGTMQTNVVGAVRLLKDALDAGLTPVFFSTDYVFDGERGGYAETDCPHPITSYGAQKLAVEAWLGAVSEPWMIARMSKVVGPETDIHSVLGQWVNDIKAGKPQRLATDQVLSPAWVDDIARALVALADGGQTGLWHVAAPEAFSRHDLFLLLLEEIQKVAPSVQAEVATCSIRDIPFAEPRPRNTSLNVDKLQDFLGWRFKPMRELCAELARAHFA